MFELQPYRNRFQMQLYRQPQAVAGAIIAHFAITSTVAIAAINIAVAVAFSVGLSFLQRALFSPDTPRFERPEPGQLQQIVRQSTAPRVKHYGRVRVGGVYAFYESRNKYLFMIIITGHNGLDDFDAIEEHILNGETVTVLPGGQVDSLPYRPDPAEPSYAHIDSALDGKYYADITTYFSEYAPSNDFEGLSTAYLRLASPDVEEYNKIFPNGVPQYNQVLRGTRLFNPNTGLTEWTENAALVIRNYIVSDDGMGLGAGVIDDAEWSQSIITSDQWVNLLAGGSERRYRISGSYALNEAPKNVLQRMLAACDGQLFYTPTGQLGLRVGAWRAPTVTLDWGKHIIATRNWRSNSDRTSAFNVLKLIYVDPDLDFQKTEADPWEDTANITLRGEELYSQLELDFVPSHGQARRLGKITTMKQNPEWAGTLILNMYGLMAYGEEMVYVNIPALGIVNEPMYIHRFKFSEEFSGIEMEVSSGDPAAFSWASSEEGVKPTVPPEFTNNSGIPTPENAAASVLAADIDDLTRGARIQLTWDIPTSDESYSGAITPRAAYRKTGTTKWQGGQTLDKDATEWLTPILDYGVNYDVSVFYRDPSGVGGQRAVVSNIPVTIAGASLSPPDDGNATQSGNDVNITWTPVDSPYYGSTKVYWSTLEGIGDGTFANATLLKKVFSPLNSYTMVNGDPYTTFGEQNFYLVTVDKNGNDGPPSSAIYINVV